MYYRFCLIVVWFILTGSAWSTERFLRGPNPAVWAVSSMIASSDGEYNDHFGYSVCVDGNYAVVGAALGLNNAGKAYIFRKDTDGWVEEAILTPGDGAPDDPWWFGFSAAISGDYVLVGQLEGYIRGGSAYVFKNTAQGWIEEAKLTASDAMAGDRFGFSVSMSGEVAIIGTPSNDDLGAESGSAYVFENIAGEWTQQQKLHAADGMANASFGTSVSIRGNHAIIGASGHDHYTGLTGAAYIFTKGTGGWTQQAKLSGNGSDEDFGCSVSIDGDHALVGARGLGPGYTEFGGAYAFRYNGSVWLQEQQVLPHDWGQPSHTFGGAVSVKGHWAIIGAWGDWEGGAAYFFERTEGSGWVERQKVTVTNPSRVADFGGSVHLDGEHAIVGAWGGINEYAVMSGTAYILESLNVCRQPAGRLIARSP